MDMYRSLSEVADALEIGRRTLHNWIQADLLDTAYRPGSGHHRKLSIRDALCIALMREFQRCTGHSPSPRIRGAIRFAWDIAKSQEYRNSVVVVRHYGSANGDSTGWSAALLGADKWLEDITPLDKAISLIPLQPLYDLISDLYSENRKRD